ncbi:MAG: outer membrane protein assembly factor BamD [Acidobacteria bacterium]|nr:outer membrane protein assembly factor BamD [Acidobacteriota bacterium]
MPLLFRLVSLLVMAGVLGACGQKSANLQEGAAPPDKVLFENGMKYLEKNQFLKARLALQTLINTYPDSEFAPAAFMGVADSYYEEGGTENLLQAEAQYKDFVVFYPTHEMTAHAQMKIAAINVKLMKPSDRDPTYARKAETELKKFITDYHDSELAPTAQEFLKMVQENLAKGIHDVGEFYFSRKSYNASESRFKEVLEKYPEYSSLDSTLYKLGESLERMGRTEEASVYYSRVAAEYPFSGFFGAAKERLTLLEKPVPPVNESLAARNQANRVEEGFSLLNPVRSIWTVFTGAEDIYEIARRRAEEKKQAEAMAKVPPSGKEGNKEGKKN